MEEVDCEIDAAREEVSCERLITTKEDGNTCPALKEMLAVNSSLSARAKWNEGLENGTASGVKKYECRASVHTFL